MKALFAILFFSTLSMSIHAQGKYDANWCFGVKAGIDFSDTSHPAHFNTLCNTSLVAASISDSLGNLLFYVAPDTPFSIGSLYYTPVSIFNGNNQVIENGSGIDVGADLTGALFLNVPEHTESYHFFYMRRIDTSVVIDLDNLYFATITKDSNGYSVVKKNQLLLAEPLQWGMSATKHANGRDWWLVLHRSNSFDTINRFYKYLITPDTIEGPFTQDIGSFHRTGLSQYGQMSISKAGNKLALPLGDQNGVDLFDFDRCTGLLANYLALVNVDTSSIIELIGCEFSSDGNKLYISGGLGDVAANNVLFQYSLTDSNIANSKKIIWESAYNSLYSFGQMQRAPDNRIYLSGGSNGAPVGINEYTQYNQHLCVINNPDSAGTACDFQFYSYYLGDSARTYWGLPNMPNYNLGPLNSVWQASAGSNTFVCSNKDTSKAHIGVSPVTGVTYAWQSAPGITDTTLPQQTVRPDSSRWYFLSLIDTTINGTCQSRTDSVYVEVRTCVGVDEIAKSAHDYHLVPNLYKDNFTAHITLGENETGEVQIFGMDGRLMGRHPVTAGTNQIDLRSDGLGAGVYLYKVLVNGETKNNGKLVVVR